MIKSWRIAVIVGWGALPVFAQTVIHAGAFPNITHPQAMVGKALGWFDRATKARFAVDGVVFRSVERHLHRKWGVAT